MSAQAATIGWREADAVKAKQNAGTVRKQFAKKANDQQHHLHLYKNAVVALDVYHLIPALMDNHQFRAAMRELEAAMSLSKKRLEL